ncbi:phospholipid carrier-dependent glycosyltransferase [Patescibacteria group bacterium]|nr:phospholipid carrier-dependent glycosyltransferase [Patescibacteria group bacterium]
MKKFILLAIILLAFILRFYRLGDYPALNADEAAIGYNVYSLIQTGMDEHGNSWPIHFQSFNDYKPGLYFYVVLPFVKFFGLNVWSVRIPGAALGVLTVVILYFLIKELFDDERLALASSFFLAISPWHLQFSRGGWEVNTATFLIVLGVWLFLKGLKNSTTKWVILYFALSVIAFALSLYAYHAARIVAPLLGLGLVIIYRKVLFKKQNIKFLILNSLFLILLLVPLAKDLTGTAVLSRIAGVGLFADPGPLSRINEQRGEHGDFTSLVAKVYHNKAVNYGLAFLGNWAKHFDGEFLFMTGDSVQRNKVPETGQMYLFDILFLAAGLMAVVKNSKGWGVVLLWLIIAPLASALTFQSPSALRAQNMVIPLVIISSFGLITILDWLKRQRKSLLAIGHWSLIIVIAWSLTRYLHMYYVHIAKEYPFSSQYGVKELVSYVEANQFKYQKVFITDRYDQPYILFLFYGVDGYSMKYPPAQFQKEHTLIPRDKYGFSTVRNFGKYYFEPIDFAKIQTGNPNSMIIGTPDEIPNEANIVKKIYGENGYIYFEIVAN